MELNFLSDFITENELIGETDYYYSVNSYDYLAFAKKYAYDLSDHGDFYNIFGDENNRAEAIFCRLGFKKTLHYLEKNRDEINRYFCDKSKKKRYENLLNCLAVYIDKKIQNEIYAEEE